MIISIIIPTLNRQDILIPLVNRLRNFFQENIELIVVDDSKKAIPDEIIKNWGEKVKYIHRGKKLGVSSARNVGSNYSMGEYLIFLDDDDAFTDSWLPDFFGKIERRFDLVFCNMKLVNPDGSVMSISASSEKKGIVIPGAWMIKKNIFDKVGGYDERLKFAENTELFFRLDRLPLEKAFIERENFIYYQSPDGGSKNLQNMTDSIRLILEKHDKFLSAHVKHLYNQNIGVIELRFQNYCTSRKYLKRAIRYKPWNLKSYMRFLLTLFPFLANRVYPLEIN